MILLDTNIFIYFANGTLDPELVLSVDISHASISKIESLGFSTIPANELLLLNELFNESFNHDLTEEVVDQAIKLRQAKKMSLGDSIIAATALEGDLDLWTANVDDFQHIEGLRIFNPLKV